MMLEREPLKEMRCGGGQTPYLVTIYRPEKLLIHRFASCNGLLDLLLALLCTAWALLPVIFLGG